MQSTTAASGEAKAEGDPSGMVLAPYWAEDGDAPPVVGPETLPARADVVVVGSGYTGLNAALVAARGGRSVVVFDAERIGHGCSTRNGGQISTSIKPSLEELTRRHGAERARAIRGEGLAALDWIDEFVRTEGIDCDFQRCGRFQGAHTPAAYERLARAAEADGQAEVISKAEQRREIGSDFYHGGVVQPNYASLHPGKYHAGLVRQVQAAGALLVPECPVTAVRRDGGNFTIRTARGEIAARDVIIATNGYSGTLLPWIRKRVIPIGSYIIATRPLAPGMIDRLFPSGRIITDTRRTVYYYRASPDRTRVLFGGRVSAAETNPRISAPRLRRDMVAIFPELATVGLSHSWMGTVAYSFDELAHCGVHDGMHYAMAYCGSGVSMASYLGMRTGQRLLGLAEGRTGFDDLKFQTRPLYTGRPWFLPAMVGWYRWRDAREVRTARQG